MPCPAPATYNLTFFNSQQLFSSSLKHNNILVLLRNMDYFTSLIGQERAVELLTQAVETTPATARNLCSTPQKQPAANVAFSIVLLIVLGENLALRYA